MHLVLGIALLFFGLSVPGVHCSKDDPIKFVRKDETIIKNLNDKEKEISEAAEEVCECLGDIVSEVTKSIESINAVFDKHTVVNLAEEDKEDIKKKIMENLDGMSPENVVKDIVDCYSVKSCDGLLYKSLNSDASEFSISQKGTCESLRQLIGFTNLFLIPLRKCGAGLNEEIKIITFESIEKVESSFGKLLGVFEDEKLASISKDTFTEISTRSTQMINSVKSLCKKAFPEDAKSELYKLVQEKESFTTKEFFKALGIEVEPEKPTEMNPADPVAGSKSQSAAEPGKETISEELKGKETTGEKTTGEEPKGEKATIKDEAKGWFARNRVWVLIATLVVVVLAAVALAAVYYTRRSNK
ncbi:hypothetical protein VCUG_02158 [Vavraia culicis subsp. floridensis]|uniref:Brl1/Brr6 domain-containing protein n=1 Tax=Vavraia culicis (isolate floridensis) TaxID=948595 RepID=L2GST8_VAVCU|nr:uncharacterized protein VCUG_02158 [Vavraia culicis subsp. floridensis]ELA46353.1 hypothetical protein VCUG_02158 [Vavraia culicis subsp. floridensis]